MPNYYWIMPEGAKNYLKEDLTSKCVSVKAKNKQAAEEVARKFRTDNVYELYTPAEKVPFERFAFAGKLDFIDLNRASNNMTEYKWSMVMMENGDEKDSGEVYCLPCDLIKAGGKLAGNHSQPRPRFEFGEQIFRPDTGAYMFVNLKAATILFISNNAKIHQGDVEFIGADEKGDSGTHLLLEHDA